MPAPTYRLWKKLAPKQINERILQCLRENVDFEQRTILGIPVSRLDEHVFSQDERLLDSSVYLRAMVANPNHIGCHTLGDSEPFFAGTQELEREAIEIVADEIFGGLPGEQDGYIASGGTEANLQALWIFRNFFRAERKAAPGEIAVLCSSDSHYSIAKGANLLDLPIRYVDVDDATREIPRAALESGIAAMRADGVRYCIVVCNLVTTMFGSVDDIDQYADCLAAAGIEFLIHVDGAYGGFAYPFVIPESEYSFANPNVTSFAIDAHKLLQAPFGTGIFVIRKGWMRFATTRDAKYIRGMDMTLTGSRSGANAIAVWMLLMAYGPHGWYEKIHLLNHRTEWLARQLTELGVAHYRHPAANIVAIRAAHLDAELIERYGLVPDDHHDPAWYKIVVMSHVTVDLLEPFVADLRNLQIK